jgi:acyl-ACP thioesterase
MSESPLVPPPSSGRVFEQSVRPGLADAAPSGRVRLDAVARWLQDVAYADVEDADLIEVAVWVVRRLRLVVTGFPRFGETMTLRTFCSGLGRMWAERRTTVVGEGGTVEAVAIWIHLDPQSRRPTPFTEAEFAVYGESAGGREVKARLNHPAPGAGATRRPWAFRAAETDLAGHINNAAYWQPLEERLLAGPDPDGIDAEIEFRSPAQPGPVEVLTEGHRMWIAAPDGEVHASLVSSAGEA